MNNWWNQERDEPNKERYQAIKLRENVVVVMRLKGKNNTKSFQSVYKVLSRICRKYILYIIF